MPKIKFSASMIVLFLVGWGAASAQEAEAPTAASRVFSSKVDVTAVELRVDVRDAQGNVPADLGVEDFEIFEDGKPVRVIGVDYPSALSDEAGGEKAPDQGMESASPKAAPGNWRLVIYIDPMTSTHTSIQRVTRALAKQASELTRLGWVEIVKANPSPQLILPFTRDSARVKAELKKIGNKDPGLDRIALIRRQFLTGRQQGRDGMSNKMSPDLLDVKENQAVSQIVGSARQEAFLIRRQLAAVEGWMDSYPADTSSALFLVSDGFDLDPREFYINAMGVASAKHEIDVQLQGFQMAPMAQELAQRLAEKGWTAVALAVGSNRRSGPTGVDQGGSDRFRAFMTAPVTSQNVGNESDRVPKRRNADYADPGGATSLFLMEHPLEPMKIAVHETGGELWTNIRKIDDAVDRLGQRLRLTYQVDRAADDSRHKLKVELKRKDLELNAPRWASSPTLEQVARARARRLLVTDQLQGDLPVNADLVLEDKVSPEDGKVAGKVKLSFDLNALAIDSNPAFPVRVTFAVRVPGGIPFVIQSQIEAVRPAGFEATEERRVPVFRADFPLRTHPSTDRIAVVIEDLRSGSWGADIVLIGGPTEGGS